MLHITAVGRVGKDAEVRQTSTGQTVTSFSLAVNTGWGDRETTRWLDCSMWGERGSKIAQYIRKGARLTVVGEMGQREYEGKTYDTLRINDLVLPPKGESSGDSAPQGNNHAGGHSATRAATPHATPPPPTDFGGDIPF